MKKKLYAIATIWIMLLGCKKNEIETVPLATLSVLNVIQEGKVARLNNNLRDSCLNMDYKHFTILAKEASPVKLYPSDGSNISYFDQKVNSGAGDIYSLFLTGTHSAPEHLLIKENIPPYPTADVANIRLVNLSPNSPAVSLVMVSPTTSDLFSNVEYNKATGFITLPMPVVSPAVPYVFQIRNSSGAVLFTYEMPVSGTVSINSSRHRNVTLALKGLVGGLGTASFGIIGLPHY